MNSGPVRIGIIGINGRGRLSRYWHHPGGKSIVAGAADLSTRNLEDFRVQCNPDAFITTDYHELLSRKDIDAIAVTTPDFCHEEQAIAALKAGKSVYCDKPMAITIEGCDRMMAAASEARQRLMIGFNMRYATWVQKMKELIDAGEIGEIKAVWVRHFIGMGSLYYYHDWHALKKNVTSLLLQKGCHDFDIIHFLTGRYVRKVAAFGGLDYFGGGRDNGLKCDRCAEKGTCLDAQHEQQTPKKPDRLYCAFRQEVDVEDNYVCMMEMEGGIKATYNECHFSPDYQRNYTFIGTKGRIENNEPEGKVWLWRRGKAVSHEQPDETFDVRTDVSARFQEVGHGGADERITSAFVEMMRTGSEPPVRMEDGRMSVAVGVMAQRSLEAGGGLMYVPQASAR